MNIRSNDQKLILDDHTLVVRKKVSAPGLEICQATIDGDESRLAYIFSYINFGGQKTYDFANFKKPEILIFNFLLPEGVALTLPQGKKCYIVNEDVSRLTIHASQPFYCLEIVPNTIDTFRSQQVIISKKRKLDESPVFVPNKEQQIVQGVHASKADEKSSSEVEAKETLSPAEEARVPSPVVTDAPLMSPVAASSSTLKSPEAKKNKNKWQPNPGEDQKARRDHAVTLLKNYLGSTAQNDAKQLRNHQRIIFQQILQAMEANNPAHYVVPLVTGGGKTLIFIRLAKITNLRTMIILPTEELIHQTESEAKADFLEDLSTEDPTLKIGRLFTKDLLFKETHAQGFKRIVAKNQIIVTSYHTLQRHYKDVPWEEIDVVVPDEAHKSKSANRVLMIQHIQSRGVAVTMFTATPGADTDKINCFTLAGFRADGEDNPVKGIPIPVAIEDKINCPIATALVPVGPETTDEQYISIAKDLYLNGSTPNGKPFRGKQGFIFCNAVEEAKNMSASFNQIDVEMFDPDKTYRVRYVYNYKQARLKLNAEVTAADCARAYKEFQIAAPIYFGLKNRDELVEKAKLGGIMLLLSKDVLREGINIPRASFGLMMRRSVRSRTVLVQTAGRLLRLDPDDPDKIATYIQIYPIYASADKRPALFAYEITSSLEKLSCGVSADFYKPGNLPNDFKLTRDDKTPAYQVVWEPKAELVTLFKPVKKKKLKKPIVAPAEQKRATERKMILPATVEEGLLNLSVQLGKLQKLFNDFNKKAILVAPKVDADNDVKMVSSENIKKKATTPRREKAAEDISPEVSEHLTETQKVINEMRKLFGSNSANAAASSSSSSSSSRNDNLAPPITARERSVKLLQSCSALSERIKKLFVKVMLKGNSIETEDSEESKQYKELSDQISILEDALTHIHNAIKNEVLSKADDANEDEELEDEKDIDLGPDYPSPTRVPEAHAAEDALSPPDLVPLPDFTQNSNIQPPMPMTAPSANQVKQFIANGRNTRMHNDPRPVRRIHEHLYELKFQPEIENGVATGDYSLVLDQQYNWAANCFYLEKAYLKKFNERYKVKHHFNELPSMEGIPFLMHGWLLRGEVAKGYLSNTGVILQRSRFYNGNQVRQPYYSTVGERNRYVYSLTKFSILDFFTHVENKTFPRGVAQVNVTAKEAAEIWHEIFSNPAPAQAASSSSSSAQPVLPNPSMSVMPQMPLSISINLERKLSTDQNALAEVDDFLSPTPVSEAQAASSSSSSAAQPNPNTSVMPQMPLSTSFTQEGKFVVDQRPKRSIEEYLHELRFEPEILNGIKTGSYSLQLDQRYNWCVGLGPLTFCYAEKFRFQFGVETMKFSIDNIVIPFLIEGIGDQGKYSYITSEVGQCPIFHGHNYLLDKHRGFTKDNLRSPYRLASAFSSIFSIEKFVILDFTVRYTHFTRVVPMYVPAEYAASIWNKIFSKEVSNKTKDILLSPPGSNSHLRRQVQALPPLSNHYATMFGASSSAAASAASQDHAMGPLSYDFDKYNL